MKPFSLRRRLIVLLLGSLTLVWGAMLVWNYFDAREEINELSDVRLEEMAHTLMQLDLKRLSALAAAGAATPAADTDAQAPRMAFQVWGDAGRLLLRSPGAPGATFHPQSGHASFTFEGEEWRSYAARDRHHGYQVRVFENGHARDELTGKLARRTAGALLLALPALALLVWFGIGRGLKPLGTLSGEIAARHANRLDPIDVARAPREAQPLIHSLNRLLARLAHSLDRERAFTADAAHELRTPLAAIKVQAQVAQAAHSETERRQATEQIIVAVNRTTRLAQQLLLLARLDNAALAARIAVNLGELVRECTARFAGEALARDIELELQIQADCVLQADPSTLAVLVDNLLDNAIKYGRRHGRITLTVARDAGEIRLSVADDGPGVPADQVERLTERFFRVSGNDAPGSGLGLPIVAKIAQTYGGRVQTGSGLGGRGLRVSVCFAVADAATVAPA